MTNSAHPDEMTSDVIDWRHSATGQTYVLQAAPYRCLVWHTLRGTWGAVVTGHGPALAAYTFSSPEEAQTWCEARVAAPGDPSPGAAAETATSTPPAAPPWRYRAIDGNYTLGHGGVHCRVWHTAADAWRAVVSHPGQAKRTQTFETREEAQAWCETQVAAIGKSPGHA